MHPSPADHLSDDVAAGSRPTANGEHDVAIGLDDAFADLASDHPGDEDDETLEAPAPPLPRGTPSPLGEDEAAAPVEDGAIHRESGVARVAPDAATGPSGDRRTPIQAIPFPDAFRTRAGVSREAVVAAREARATARREQATTRLVVLAIWSAAVLLASLLALFALGAR